MDIAIAVAIIVFGLVVSTVGGAQWALRYSDKHPHSGSNNPRAKTVGGTRVVGVLIIIFGIVWLVASL